ncbi:MAG: VanZ family protein [Paludibacter sp.]|nr:VanZ family protein [Paludibacter sp.]
MFILKNYWKSLIIISCILYLSFASPSSFKDIPTFHNEDKLVHILMYFGLSIVLIFDYRRSANNNINLLAFVLICLIFPTLLGGGIEISQGQFFAPRTASWLDWLADITGVLIGWMGMSLFKPKKQLK